MPRSDFQLTAEILLVGPRNLGAVTEQMKKSFAPVTAGANKGYADLTKSLQSTQKAMVGFGKTVSGLGPKLSRVQPVAKQTATRFKQIGTNAKQSQSYMYDFGKTTGFVTKRLIGFRIASGFVLGFGGAMRSAIGDAIEFESQLVKVAQVTGKSLPALSRLSKEITNLSVKYGVNSGELVTVSKTLSQAGLSARDTRVALEALAKSTLLPTFGDLNQTVEGSVAILNQFGLEAKDLMSVISAIDAVTGKFAVEASDVTIAVQKAGGVFAALNKDVDNGVESFNEFLAIFASVRQTTRESAQNIAVGLRTIFARIQRPQTIQFLKDFGIELEGVGDKAGELLKPMEILDNLSNALGNVNARNLNIGAIVQQLGGTRQVAKVLPLLFQMELRHKALDTAIDGQAGAEIRLNKALDTLKVRLGQVREEFKAFVRELVGSNTFQLIVKQVLKLVQSFTKLASLMKPLMPALAVIAGVKAIKYAKPFALGLGSGLASNPLDKDGGMAISPTAKYTVAATHKNTTAILMLANQMKLATTKTIAQSQLGARQFAAGGVINGMTAFGPRDQLATGKTTKITRRMRAGQTASRYAGGLAIGGMILGGAASDALGSKTRGRAASGGTLVGAGIGAMGGSAIGSVVPGAGTAVGAALGGLAGGLAGAISALNEFENTLRTENIEDSLEHLTNIFDKFSKGQIDLGGVQKLAAKQYAGIYQEIKGGFGRDVKVPAARSASSSFQGAQAERIGTKTVRVFGKDEIEDFGKDLKAQFSVASDELNAGVVADFKDISFQGDVDDFDFSTILEDISPARLVALGAAFGDVDEAAQKAGTSEVKLKEELEKLGQAEYKALGKAELFRKKLYEISVALDLTQSNFVKLGKKLDFINRNVGQEQLANARTSFARAQGKTLAGQDFQRNVFENIQGTSRSDVQNELKRVGIGGELESSVNLARDLPGILRDVTSNIKLASGAGPTEVRDEIRKSLSTKFEGYGESGQQVSGFLQNKLGADLNAASTQDIFDLLSKDLPPHLKTAVEHVQKFTDGLNAANKDLRAATDQRIQLELSLASAASQTDASSVSQQRQLDSAITGRQSTLGERLQPGQTSLMSLSGHANLAGLQQQRQGIQQDIRNVSPGSSPESQMAADQELAQLYGALGRNTLALEQVSQGALGLAEVMRELNTIQQQREATQRRIQDAALMGPEERLGEIRGLQQLISFQQGSGPLTEAALRTGQKEQSAMSASDPVLAQRLGTILTRGVPGSNIPGGGIGTTVRGGTGREQALAQQGRAMVSDQTAAANMLNDERRQAADMAYAESQAAFLQKRTALDNKLITGFETFATPATALAEALNTSQIEINVNTPNGTSAELQGMMDVWAQQIADKFANQELRGLMDVWAKQIDPTNL